jgi:hypothetical protein
VAVIGSANDARCAEPVRLRPADELLGADHPLAAAGRDARHAGARLAALAVFVAGAVVIALVHGRSPKGLIVAGMLAAPVLVVRLAATLDTCRRRAREAIVAGLEDVPARELRDTRRRLARPRYRHDLALALRRLADFDALRGASPDGAEPDDVPALLERVAGDLDALDLRRVRGIAVCEQLVDDGVLVRLANGDREQLRTELGRLHFLLVAD